MMNNAWDPLCWLLLLYGNGSLNGKCFSSATQNWRTPIESFCLSARTAKSQDEIDAGDEKRECRV